MLYSAFIHKWHKYSSCYKYCSKASVSIQTLGSDSSFRIKVDQGAGGEDLKKISDTISNSLETKFSEGGKVVIDSIEQVGPQVGKDLKRQALLAVLYAVIGILILSISTALSNVTCTLVPPEKSTP